MRHRFIELSQHYKFLPKAEMRIRVKGAVEKRFAEMVYRFLVPSLADKNRAQVVVNNVISFRYRQRALEERPAVFPVSHLLVRASGEKKQCRARQEGCPVLQETTARPPDRQVF